MQIKNKSFNDTVKNELREYYDNNDGLSDKFRKLLLKFSELDPPYT
jgi:hypothetical protein